MVSCSVSGGQVRVRISVVRVSVYYFSVGECRLEYLLLPVYFILLEHRVRSKREDQQSATP